MNLKLSTWIERRKVLLFEDVELVIVLNSVRLSNKVFIKVVEKVNKFSERSRIQSTTNLLHLRNAHSEFAH